MGLGGTWATSIEFVCGPIKGIQQPINDLDRIGKKANNTRQQFANLAGAFTGMVAAGWIKQGITALLKPTVDMETSLAKIKGLTGAGAEELKRYKEKAVEVAKISPLDPVEMVDAMAKLRQVTGSTDAALKGLKTTAMLSMASFGKLSAEGAAEMMGGIIRGFRASGDEATVMADKVFAATKAVGLPLETMSNVMGRLGAAAMRGGQSFDEVVKAFVMIRSVYPSGERAATMIMKLGGEMGTYKARKGLGAIGVDTIDNSTGKLKSLSTVLMDLTVRYKHSSVLVKDALNNAFGERAAAPMFAMLSKLGEGMRTNTGELLKGADAANYLDSAMQNSAGGLGKMGETFQQSIGGQISLVKEGVTNLALVLGEALLPALSAAVKAATPLLDLLTGILKLPGVSTITAVVGTIVVLKTGLFALRAAGQGIVQIFGVVISNLNRTSIAARGAGNAVAEATRKMSFSTSLNQKIGLASGLPAFQGPLQPGGVPTPYNLSVGQKVKAAGSMVLGALGGIPGIAIAVGSIVFSHWDDIKKYAKDNMDEGVKKDLEFLSKGKGFWGVVGRLIYEKEWRLEDARVARMEKERELLRKKEDLANLEAKKAEEVLNHFQLASNAMTKALKDVDEILGYKPKVAEWSKLDTLFGATKRLGKGKLGVDDKTQVDNMLRIMNQVTTAQGRSIKGILSPQEGAQQLDEAITVLAGARHFAAQGMLPWSVVQGFEDKVLNPLRNQYSKGGRESARRISVLRNNNLPTTGEDMPGFGPQSLGGLDEEVSKGILPPLGPGESSIYDTNKPGGMFTTSSGGKLSKFGGRSYDPFLGVVNEMQRANVLAAMRLKEMNDQLLKGLDVRVKEMPKGADPMGGGRQGVPWNEGGY